MLKGAIDFSDGERIGGWVYSDVAPMRGRTVLAFLDRECVGAGQIEHFRQDLADAGLGDGYLGFNFAIGLPAPRLAKSVVIQLEGSDFLLAQPGTTFANNDPSSAGAFKDYSLDEIEWMRQREWLDQNEFDFLKYLSVIGIYDRSLVRDQSGLSDLKIEARRLMELYNQKPLTIKEQQVSLDDLSVYKEGILSDLIIPVVAIFSNEGYISILEGSHRDEVKDGAPDMSGAVRHRFGSDRLLFVDFRATCVGQGGKGTIFLATSDI